MDHYEELGLRRTATVKEIRQAYKVMARLVHPDGQAQDPVRQMAERQMKRLNQILAILTDQESRRQYDAGLAIALSPPAIGATMRPNGGVTRPVPWPRGPQLQIAPPSLRIPDWLQPVAEHWFWVAMGLMVAAVGVWYAASGGRPLAPAGDGDSAAAGVGIQRHTSPLAGNWLLAPDPLEKTAPGTYPATYVELLLAEDRGQMWGNYRAEYTVPDRAALPEVRFQVRGETPAGTSANFKWTAADGAKGEVELALTGQNTIKVTWWTTDFGRHRTLASGVAKLVRQQVR